MVCQQDFSATHLSASILKQHWLRAYVWLGLPSRKSDEIRVSGLGSDLVSARTGEPPANGQSSSRPFSAHEISNSKA